MKTTFFTKPSIRNRIIIIALLILILGIFLIRNTLSARVHDGDMVAVNYIGKLDDGAVFDTNIKAEAVKVGINDKRDYQPLVFQVGKGTVVKGFDKAVIGMKTGQEKTVTIQPADAYGERQDELIIKNRKKQFERNEYSMITPDEFRAFFKKEPELNEIISTQLSPIKLQVTNMGTENITLKNLATIGQKIQLQGVAWETVVTNIANGIIIFEQHPTVGDHVVVPLQEGQQTIGRITRVGTDDYDVDINHELAGKTLTFTITLVSFETPEAR